MNLCDMRVGKASTYSPTEAAGILGVTPKTIHRRVKAKLIPVIPNLGRVRITQPLSLTHRATSDMLGES